ncbi:MAG: sRNA-binding regulator protein Hfq [Verrucomicrobiales bacterium]|jgi:sRNA-binding regulator protein Hfq
MTHDASAFDQELAKMTDGARRSESARLRMQRSDRALAAALSGTFAGTLTELAETQAPVTVLTRNGSSIRGTIHSLGPDVVVLSPAERQHRVLIRRIAIEALLETGDGHDREVDGASTGPEMAELLDEYSVDKQRLALTMSSGNRLMGAVLRVGVDQMVIRLDGDADSMTVPLHAIDQVVMAT